MSNQTQTLGLLLLIALASGALAGGMTAFFMNQGSSPSGPEIEFTLQAFISGFVGVGGDIDGKTNPDLVVPANAKVTIKLLAGDGMPHDFTIDDLVQTDLVALSGNEEATATFAVGDEGTLIYYCSVPGHYTSMNGKLIIGESTADSPDPAVNLDKNVIRKPNDIPAPVGNRSATNVEFTIITEEVTAKLDDGTSFTFWTFNGAVPGPLIRVRVGDNATIHLKNPSTSEHTHSIDFHAVNKDGGGAAFTQAKPGETKSFSFIAEWEGVFIYHCASPHVPTHISKGMYGTISVEPAGGLLDVDYEFYVGQNEIYTKYPKGTQGHQEFDDRKQLEENPDYVIFNGMVNALTLGEYSLNVTINSTVRLFFAVGGPNIISNFHLIGGVWNRVYYETDWSAPNMYNAETIAVVPGSALAIEIDITRTGKFILVDHALTRTFDKGALGFMYAT